MKIIPGICRNCNAGQKLCIKRANLDRIVCRKSDGYLSMHPASAKMTAKKDDGICSWGQLAGFIHADNGNPIIKMRSEERRVGKEC